MVFHFHTLPSGRMQQLRDLREGMRPREGDPVPLFNVNMHQLPFFLRIPPYHLLHYTDARRKRRVSGSEIVLFCAGGLLPTVPRSSRLSWSSRSRIACVPLHRRLHGGIDLKRRQESDRQPSDLQERLNRLVQTSQGFSDATFRPATLPKAKFSARF
jgi:hypothetical protein